MTLPLGREMPVAVKVPKTSLDDAIHRARVEREIATALSLSYHHPNLVGAYGWGIARDGQPFLVMELVVASLGALSERCHLGSAMLWRIASDVLQGLAYVHEQGILHRDVSAGNVMLSQEGSFKLGDFGGIRDQSGSAAQMFRPTPAYTSPEIFDKLHFSPKSDAYALGAVLYELVMGEGPYGSDDYCEIFRRAIQHEVPEPLPAQLPAALAELIDGLIQRDVDERYGVQKALERVEAHRQDASDNRAVRALLAEYAAKANTLEPERPIDLPSLEGAVLQPLTSSSATPQTYRMRPGRSPTTANRYRYQPNQVARSKSAALSCQLAQETRVSRALIDNRYRLQKQIGHGGQAEIWSALQIMLDGSGQTVALKRVLPREAHDSSLIERLEREARFCLTMRHDNVVNVLDYVTDEEGQRWLVMEHVDGITLEQLVDSTAPSPNVMMQIFCCVTQGLSYVHGLGVIHRDIKPENIMITRTGTVKIMDFGLAKRLDEPPTPASQDRFLGTVGFASPEAVLGNKVDPSSDLYSLAATFYNLMTDQMAIPGIPYMPSDLPGAFKHIFKALLVRRGRRHYRTADELFARVMTMSIMGEIRPATTEDVAAGVGEAMAWIEENRETDGKRITVRDEARWLAGEMPEQPQSMAKLDSRGEPGSNQVARLKPVTQSYPVAQEPCVTRGLIDGRYELEKRIGRGGMAEVWRAWKNMLDGSKQRVALKRVRPFEANKSWLTKRLDREARECIKLSHDNVVKVLDYIEGNDGERWLVMEYIEGVTLEQLVAHADQPPSTMLLTFGGVLDGLRYIHARKLIHRDVTPGNIMITRQGAIKLMDFGLAKRLDQSTSPLSKDKRLGTRTFASPEALVGETQDPSSDLYSLAATFYVLMTGQPPIRATSPMPSHLPMAFRHIFESLLKLREERRYKTAEDLHAQMVKMWILDRSLLTDTQDLAARVEQAMAWVNENRASKQFTANREEAPGEDAYQSQPGEEELEKLPQLAKVADYARKPEPGEKANEARESASKPESSETGRRGWFLVAAFLISLALLPIASWHMLSQSTPDAAVDNGSTAGESDALDNTVMHFQNQEHEPRSTRDTSQRKRWHFYQPGSGGQQ